MTREDREDDRADPPGLPGPPVPPGPPGLFTLPGLLTRKVLEEYPKYRDTDQDHEQLTELDAHVERQKRDYQVISAERQHVPQRVGETEPVHESEPEYGHPAPAQAGGNDVLQRHVDDGGGDHRFHEGHEP